MNQSSRKIKTKTPSSASLQRLSPEQLSALRRNLNAIKQQLERQLRETRSEFSRIVQLIAKVDQKARVMSGKQTRTKEKAREIRPLAKPVNSLET